jgi:hypothetical protein
MVTCVFKHLRRTSHTMRDLYKLIFRPRVLILIRMILFTQSLIGLPDILFTGMFRHFKHSTRISNSSSSRCILNFAPHTLQCLVQVRSLRAHHKERQKDENERRRQHGVRRDVKVSGQSIGRRGSRNAPGHFNAATRICGWSRAHLISILSPIKMRKG